MKNAHNSSKRIFTHIFTTFIFLLLLSFLTNDNALYDNNIFYENGKYGYSFVYRVMTFFDNEFDSIYTTSITATVKTLYSTPDTMCEMINADSENSLKNAVKEYNSLTPSRDVFYSNIYNAIPQYLPKYKETLFDPYEWRYIISLNKCTPTFITTVKKTIFLGYKKRLLNRNRCFEMLLKLEHYK